MPFKSRRQRAWMYDNKPDMAERWERETPSDATLPERAPKRGKIKQAEPPPPDGVSGKEWDRILSRGPGRLKKADFPMGAGPEDWDAVGTSGQIGKDPGISKDKADAKEKVSQGDDVFDNDGTRIVPHLRHIHKMGYVKLAQGFEYADTGPNAGEVGPRVSWQMPGKLKRSAGLDQEKGLDEPERGTDPPAAFPQPEGRLEALARSQGPLKKVSQASWRAMLEELWKLGSDAGALPKKKLEPLSPKEKRREFFRFIQKASPAVGAGLGALVGVGKGLKGGQLTEKVLSGVGTGTLIGAIPAMSADAASAWRRFRERTD